MLDIYTMANAITRYQDRKEEGLLIWTGYEHQDYEFEFVGNSKGIFAFRYWSKTPDQWGARRKSSLISLVHVWTKLTIKHHVMTGYSDIAMDMAEEYKDFHSTTVNEYWYSEAVKASKIFKFWRLLEQREIDLSYLIGDYQFDNSSEEDFEKSIYYGVHVCDLGLT